MKSKLFSLLFLVAISVLVGLNGNYFYEAFCNRDAANKIITYQGQNISLTIRDINESNYKGKVMVVKTKDPGNIKIALSEGGLGTTETTSSMARRTGAVAPAGGLQLPGVQPGRFALG